MLWKGTRKIAFLSILNLTAFEIFNIYCNIKPFCHPFGNFLALNICLAFFFSQIYTSILLLPYVACCFCSYLFNARKNFFLTNKKKLKKKIKPPFIWIWDYLFRWYFIPFAVMRILWNVLWKILCYSTDTFYNEGNLICNKKRKILFNTSHFFLVKDQL